MTLLNSITSLIQYQPPGPNNIVLDKFYCVYDCCACNNKSHRISCSNMELIVHITLFIIITMFGGIDNIL